jgi:hypothetical protein
LGQVIVELTRGFFFGKAIFLLQHADQLIAPAVDLVQIVIREHAPPFLDLAADLRPLAFQNILFHV